MRVSSNKLLQKYAQPTSHNAVTLLSAQNLSDSNFPEAAHTHSAVTMMLNFRMTSVSSSLSLEILPGTVYSAPTMSVVYKPLALTIPLPDATAARKIYCGKPDKSVSDSREMMTGHKIELTLCFLWSASQQKKETIQNQV